MHNNENFEKNVTYFDLQNCPSFQACYQNHKTFFSSLPMLLANKLECFSLAKLFQPSLMFAKQGWSEPKWCSALPYLQILDKAKKNIDKRSSLFARRVGDEAKKVL